LGDIDNRTIRLALGRDGESWPCAIHASVEKSRDGEKGA